MIDRTVVCLAVFCFALFGSEFLYAQNSSGQDLFEAMLRKKSSEKLTPEEIQDIMQIRSRLGGGTGLELDEVFTKYSTQRQEEPARYFQKLDDANRHTPVVAAEKLFWQMLDSFQTSQTSQADQSAAQTRSLRSIARRLEEIAADLEEWEMFDNADQLRLQAAKVRQQSREQIRQATLEMDHLR